MTPRGDFLGEALGIPSVDLGDATVSGARPPIFLCQPVTLHGFEGLTGRILVV